MPTSKPRRSEPHAHDTQKKDRKPMRYPKQRAISIAAQAREQADHVTLASLEELTQLAGTLDIQVVQRVVQKRDAVTSTYLGEGKLRELQQQIEHAPAEAPIDCVIADNELSAGQQRALELALGRPVLDRTGVILRIFERHAHTPRAKLEVEIAQLTYALPRVRDDVTLRDSQGGGGGRGERGHTQVELVKQQMRQRLSRLRYRLEHEQQAEDDKRNGARKRSLGRVALVGYTNAGKSSWMRALTGSQVLVEDKLFATLGVTTRALQPPTRPEIVVTDTVGFLRQLPHELMASFRATLDEARGADLLLVVVDAADPEWPQQLRVTRETLAALGIHAPQQLVFYKIDRVLMPQRVELQWEHPDALLLSAHVGEDVSTLRASIVTTLERGLPEAVLEVPYASAASAAEIRSQARVLDEQYGEHGTLLRVRAPSAALARWRAALA